MNRAEGGGKSGRLNRVMLSYQSGTLEFSIIIPNGDKFKK